MVRVSHIAQEIRYMWQFRVCIVNELLEAQSTLLLILHLLMSLLTCITISRDG